MSMVQECEEMTRFETSYLAWVVCFCSSLFFFYAFIQGNMFASIADNIMRDFHIGADKMAWLSSIYYLSNILFLLIAGPILDRYPTKKVMMTAMIVCVFSTFILAFAQSLFLALICRFLAGIGSAFCFLGPVRLASRWFPPRRMAMVTGVIVTMAMTGGMLAQYPLTRLVAQTGWRDAMMQVGYLGVVILAFMYMGIIEKAAETLAHPLKKIQIPEALKRVYSNPQIFKAAFYASLMNMAIAVFGALMGTLYMMQRLGISKEDAALVNSMLFLGAIIGGPVIGWCSDKSGRRVLPMAVGLLASLVTVLLILYLPLSLSVMKILFFMLGFFTAAQIISYALVAESNSPELTATAVSVVSLLVQGGYILYQNIFSLLLTWHGEVQILQGTPIYSLGDYQFAAIILPVGLLLAFIALAGLKETHGRHSEM